MSVEDVRVDREISRMESAEMGNSGMCFPCVDLFTSHSVHAVIDLFLRSSGVTWRLITMTTDCCTELHHVTLLEVYQSLATSIRTMVKALPRA